MPRMTDPEQQLASFLAKYTPEVAKLAEALRGRMRKLYPTALELVYDNYNALAIGYGPSEKASEAIFSIALYPKWVSFFFLQARGLRDPEQLLQGGGTVCKHIVMTSPDDLSVPAIDDLRQQALELANVPRQRRALPYHQIRLRQPTRPPPRCCLGNQGKRLREPYQAP
jgi:hypothetical protein